MKFIAILVLVLLLVSCGGNGSNDTATATLDPNTIHIKILKSTGYNDSGGPPLTGVLVQLDHNGESARSDINGNVSFSITDANEHDIHVFGENGFKWESIYSIKKGIVNKVQLYNPNDVAPRPQNPPSQEESYVAFSGTITNYNPNNNYSFIFYNRLTGEEYKGSNTKNPDKPSDYYQTVFTFNIAAGSSISGEILVLEKQDDRVTETGNVSQTILIDAANIALATYVTSEVKDNYNNLTMPLLSINNKLAQTDIVTLTDMIIPKGLNFFDLALYQDYESNPVDGRKPLLSLNTSFNDSLILPKTFQSYTPYDYSKVAFFAFAENEVSTSYLQWDISGYFSRYDSFTIDPIIKVLPNFPEFQTGSLINWNVVDGNLTYLHLSISDISYSNQSPIWNITLPKNATMIQLPIIPTEIKSIFINTKNYLVVLGGGAKNDQRIEHFKVRYSGWTLTQ
ncbi:hypothetical protein MNBD_GAMMA22-2231 [hydrothermal vent metagenome]|uniref:Uncharacterized protein n=1 Tax=hydrothermal vent metagenome TaxID=652676 RepID=A0A3B1AAV6_9ZZZZ